METGASSTGADDDRQRAAQSGQERRRPFARLLDRISSGSRAGGYTARPQRGRHPVGRADRAAQCTGRWHGPADEKLSAKYPEIVLLRTAPGVGPIVAAAYVLTLGQPDAASNRSAGAFLGLRPAQSQSGAADPQRRISKAGDSFLRSLLVQSAQYVLGRFGPDSELRRWGLKLAATGGKRGKKQAIVAVARKLAVVLHALWRSGQRFQPFPQQAAVAA
ncbi:MAG TPA: transposase [Terracidiphilus sp.]|nr:transposase [Terracidiphilus sp.]